MGLIYLKPSLGQDLESILPSLQQVLEEVNDIKLNAPLIVGGDFNAWIGHDGSYPPELLEGSALSPDRSLPPSMSNVRGSILSDFFKDNGQILLNGRTPGDIPANFTYVGSRGRSTIDFAFIDLMNLHLVHDFTVEQSILPSDHFPITLDLLGPPSGPVATQKQIPRPSRLTWKRERINEYIHSLSEPSSLIFDRTAETNTLMASLYRSISKAADTAGMRIKESQSNSFRPHKPWFDRECREAKRKTDKLLQSCQDSAFQPPDTSEYHTSKKSYFDLMNEKKNEFYDNIREKIANTRSPGDFWQAIRSCRKKTASPQLDVQVWQSFYADIYPPAVPDNFNYSGNSDPRLDDDVSRVEIERVLVGAKSGKAAGPD